MIFKLSVHACLDNFLPSRKKKFDSSTFSDGIENRFDINFSCGESACFLFYMNVCLLMYTVCVPRSQRPEEGAASPGIGATDSCEPSGPAGGLCSKCLSPQSSLYLQKDSKNGPLSKPSPSWCLVQLLLSLTVGCILTNLFS